MERWAPVKGYEKIYEISTLGRCRRLIDNRSGKPFIFYKKPVYVTHGYPAYGLKDFGKQRKTVSAHRLVAIAFLGYKKGKEVDHLNGDRKDCRLENLEWVTHRENLKRKIIRNAS